MAGDEREIGEGSQLMIHNALAPNAGGNKYEMAEAIERLEQIDADMKKIYSSGTGLQDQILESMLEKETFLNADEATKLGFATGKGDVVELVAIYNENKYKDDANMAELDEKEMSFLQAIFAKIGFSPKAESEEPVAMDEEEEEDAKAESEEAPEAMEEKEEAEAMDEEEEKAEDSDEEMEALKAKVAELESALEAKLDKEVEAKKHILVFEAIKENKLTLAEGRDSMALCLEDVQAKVEQAVISPSGYEKSHVSVEAVVNHADEYLALSGFEQTSYFSKHEKEIIKQLKDK
jgi:hypothetical protein